MDNNTPTNFVPRKNSKYEVWSTEQNKALLSGYFHLSNDSEVGSGQKGDTFWGKIIAYVNDSSTTDPNRTQTQCISHYRDLNKRINIWVGAYRKVMSERRSGWSDDEYISRAQEVYIEETRKRFTLIGEWKLVHNQPKYMVGSGASGSSSSGYKRKSSSDNTGISSSNPSLERPEGRETTKKKSKASGSKSSSSRKSKAYFEEMYAKIDHERQVLKQDRERGVVAMETSGGSYLLIKFDA